MSSADFSVLMSVYHGSDAAELKDALQSIYTNSLLPTDIVLVEDGPVGDSIEKVISEFIDDNSIELNVLRLKKNNGLGIALNEGLEHCKNSIVARMDSDDICDKDRFIKQYKVFVDNPELDICSGHIYEFIGSPFDKTGVRRVPLTNEDIISFSHKRNPFNHPAVMFRREAVIKAGGYSEEYHLFEDYDLWVRMLKDGANAINLDEHLVYMRTTKDIYKRRGGRTYGKDMLRFHKHLRDTGWSTKWDYTTGAIPHYIICILPNFMRKAIYKLLH